MTGRRSRAWLRLKPTTPPARPCRSICTRPANTLYRWPPPSIGEDASDRGDLQVTDQQLTGSTAPTHWKPGPPGAPHFTSSGWKTSELLLQTTEHINPAKPVSSAIRHRAARKYGKPRSKRPASTMEASKPSFSLRLKPEKPKRPALAKANSEYGRASRYGLRWSTKSFKDVPVLGWTKLWRSTQYPQVSSSRRRQKGLRKTRRDYTKRTCTSIRKMDRQNRPSTRPVRLSITAKNMSRTFFTEQGGGLVPLFWRLRSENERPGGRD